MRRLQRCFGPQVEQSSRFTARGMGNSGQNLDQSWLPCFAALLTGLCFAFLPLVLSPSSTSSVWSKRHQVRSLASATCLSRRTMRRSRLVRGREAGAGDLTEATRFRRGRRESYSPVEEGTLYLSPYTARLGFRGREILSPYLLV